MKQILVLIGVASLLVMSYPVQSAKAAAADGPGPWADSVYALVQGTQKGGSPVLANRSVGNAALGVSETSGAVSDVGFAVGSFLSLGFGGTVTLGFDNTILNGNGNDIRVYEVTGGVYPDEKVKIEASYNGTQFWTLAEAATRDAEVDLGDYPCAKFIKLTDASNPSLFSNDADGYDVDAVQALNNGTGECGASISIDKSVSVEQEEVLPGEEVLYTYLVTNTGQFPLNTVEVSDDKCSPVVGPAVDQNNDTVLSPDEEWVFTCTAQLDVNTTNIGTVTALDPFKNPVSDEDSQEVTVSNPGCTLTQGYWKNHAEGDKYDEAWGTAEADWLTILQTPPKKGNAWYILAHQYIAAKLNIANGADDTEIADELAEAAILLEESPETVGAKTFSKTERQKYISIAGILGSYNEGLIGPGHCSEMQLLETLVLDTSDWEGVTSSVSLVNGKEYHFHVSGTWNNRPGEIVDAKFVSQDGWLTQTEGPSGPYDVKLLDLQVDNSWYDWGLYSTTHEYSGSYLGDGSSVNFRVFDGDVAAESLNIGWYDDNDGSLTIQIYTMN